MDFELCKCKEIVFRELSSYDEYLLWERSCCYSRVDLYVDCALPGEHWWNGRVGLAWSPCGEDREDPECQGRWKLRKGVGAPEVESSAAWELSLHLSLILSASKLYSPWKSHGCFPQAKAMCALHLRVFPTSLWGQMRTPPPTASVISHPAPWPEGALSHSPLSLKDWEGPLFTSSAVPTLGDSSRLHTKRGCELSRPLRCRELLPRACL